MKTLPLSPSISTDAWSIQTERSEEAAIVGEISERLFEWSKIHNQIPVFSWLSTISGDDSKSCSRVSEGGLRSYVKRMREKLDRRHSQQFASVVEAFSVEFPGKAQEARLEIAGDECRCQIADLLVEFMEVSGEQRVRSWLSRIATIGQDAESSEAVWMVLRISTGDLAQLSASFTELGAAHHRTKQAEQQEAERAIRVIQRHFPELAHELQALTRHFASDSSKSKGKAC